VVNLRTSARVRSLFRQQVDRARNKHRQRPQERIDVATTEQPRANTESGGANGAGAEVKQRAQEATGQIGGMVRERVDQGSTMAGDRISSQAGDVRSVAEQLRQQGKDKPAEMAEKAAERAERVGRYLTESDGERLLSDAERIGRERPWAVIAGGMTLGLVASRLLKASSSERYQRSGANGSSGTRALNSPSPTPTGYSIGAPADGDSELRTEDGPAAPLGEPGAAGYGTTAPTGGL
jgi:hypothetical protein